MTKDVSFVKGDTVKLRSEWRVGDTLTNPSSTTCRVQQPDAVDLTPSVNSDSTGKKSASFAVTQAGYHNWRWSGSGTAAGVTEGSFYVYESAITA